MLADTTRRHRKSFYIIHFTRGNWGVKKNKDEGGRMNEEGSAIRQRTVAERISLRLKQAKGKRKVKSKNAKGSHFAAEPNPLWTTCPIRRSLKRLPRILSPSFLPLYHEDSFSRQLTCDPSMASQ
jgi:hypothetical protein